MSTIVQSCPICNKDRLIFHGQCVVCLSNYQAGYLPRRNRHPFWNMVSRIDWFYAVLGLFIVIAVVIHSLPVSMLAR